MRGLLEYVAGRIAGWPPITETQRSWASDRSALRLRRANDRFDQRVRLLLLNEVATGGERAMGLPLRPRHVGLEDRVEPAEDGVEKLSNISADEY